VLPALPLSVRFIYGNSSINNSNNNGDERIYKPEKAVAATATNHPPPPQLALRRQQQQQQQKHVLLKTPNVWYVHVRQLTQGSLLHSVVLATCIGTVCGVAAYVYHVFLEWALQLLWNDLLTRFFRMVCTIKPMWP
jgi:hypothetical protein